MCLSLLSLELLNIELFSGDNEQKILAKLPRVLNDSEAVCAQRAEGSFQRVAGLPGESPPPSLGSLLPLRVLRQKPTVQI